MDEMKVQLIYIIQAHNYPIHLKRLVSRLNTKDSFFYVHIDKKISIELFKKEIEGFNNIFFVKNRVDVSWGDISQVYATLNSLEQIIQDKRHGYCILMSGQDYPIKSNDEIKKIYFDNYGTNFMSINQVENIWPNGYKGRINKYNFHPNSTSKACYTIENIFSKDFYRKGHIKVLLSLFFKHHKFNHFKYILRNRRHPDYFKPFGGSNWWALPMETIHEIVDFIEKTPSFLKYHKYTHCPDEIFFHTLVHNLLGSSQIKESLTYVNWSRNNCSLPVTFETRNDLEELSKTACLFARKFIENSPILDEIDKNFLRVTS